MVATPSFRPPGHSEVEDTSASPGAREAEYGDESKAVPGPLAFWVLVAA